MNKCPVCKGSGKILLLIKQVPCDECNGTGAKDERPQVYQNEDLDIDLFHGRQVQAGDPNSPWDH